MILNKKIMIVIVFVFFCLNNLFGQEPYLYFQTPGINQNDVQGNSEPPDPIIAFKTVSEDNQIPDKYTLHHAYPNPFNPVTRIKFGLPEKSHIQLVVYDLLGREIVNLKSGIAVAGWHSIQWGGYNIHGTKVPSGIYIYTLTAESFESEKNFVETKKIVLLK